MNRLIPAFSRLRTDLLQLDCRWAIIGGLAVSARSEPRTTQDLDLALVVSNDREAENLTSALVGRGYRYQQPPLEHLEAQRLATARLLTPDPQARGVIIDLMFASSGIEQEIVQAAEILEIFPNLTAPVASMAHLLAMKILAGRFKDLADFESLLRYANEEDLQRAREALDLVIARGYDRGKDLLAQFSRLVEGAE